MEMEGAHTRNGGELLRLEDLVCDVLAIWCILPFNVSVPCPQKQRNFESAADSVRT